MPTSWAQVAAEFFNPRTLSYAVDPVAWLQDRMPLPVGVATATETRLWSSQIEIMQSVRDYRTTAVKACHSSGKSATAAYVAAWWIDSHPPGTAFVVTSAPTAPQVKAILWRELRRVHRDLYGETGQGGHINLVEWYDRTGDLVAFGRKPNDYDPTALQGIHAIYVLVILDESCGIAKMLWDAASTITSNKYGRVLAIGNPDDPLAHFASVCRQDGVNTITIRADQTPNFTGELVTKEASLGLVSPEWVEDRRVVWTESSPMWISKILAEFPTDADDGTIPNSWAQPCRWLELQRTGDRQIGLDVAAGGTDTTVAWLRDGPVAVQKWAKQGESDPLALADWVVNEVIIPSGAKKLAVDSIGVGWGVGGLIDAAHREGRHDCMVTPVSVSEKAQDDEHFLNLRAELWWAARERSRLKEWDLGALDDDDLADLCAPRYHTQNPRRRIQVESKQDLRRRIGHSPDSPDALLLAYIEDRSSMVDYSQVALDWHLDIGF